MSTQAPGSLVFRAREQFYSRARARARGRHFFFSRDEKFSKTRHRAYETDLTWPDLTRLYLATHDRDPRVAIDAHIPPLPSPKIDFVYKQRSSIWQLDGAKGWTHAIRSAPSSVSRPNLPSAFPSSPSLFDAVAVYFPASAADALTLARARAREALRSRLEEKPEFDAPPASVRAYARNYVAMSTFLDPAGKTIRIWCMSEHSDPQLNGSETWSHVCIRS